MDYIAIDFETANHKLSSACSLGLIGVENNKVVFEKYYLINPEDEFSSLNTYIHHLKYSDVVDAPTFKELYQELREVLNHQCLVAHNAIFDISVLKSCIDRYKLEPLDITFCCTLKISRKIWKETLNNHKLGTMSQYLEVEHNYHDALSDSMVCVEIINRALKATNTMSLDELYDSLGIDKGIYNSEGIKPSLVRKKRNERNKSNQRKRNA